MVQKIAKGAAMQSQRSLQLRERADIIRESVHKTGDHLKEQTVHTDKLVQQALSLVAAVSVFTLKKEEETDSSITSIASKDGDTAKNQNKAIDTSDIDIDIDFDLNVESDVSH